MKEDYQLSDIIFFINVIFRLYTYGDNSEFLFVIGGIASAQRKFESYFIKKLNSITLEVIQSFDLQPSLYLVWKTYNVIIFVKTLDSFVRREVFLCTRMATSTVSILILSTHFIREI